MDRPANANENLNSELLVVRNVNQNLQNRIINPEKQQFKLEQYNRCNNVEICRIWNEVSDEDLEKIIGIGIGKDSGIDVNALDIEGCHRLPLGRNATIITKKMLV